jgi:hypothetical protein
MRLKLNEEYGNKYLTTELGIIFYNNGKNNKYIEIDNNIFDSNRELKELVRQGLLIREDSKKEEPKKDSKKEELKKDSKKEEPKKDSKKEEPKKETKESYSYSNDLNQESTNSNEKLK